MTDIQLDTLIKNHHCPYRVDVTDAVMHRIMTKPLLSPGNSIHTHRISIAASVIVLLTVGAFFAHYRYTDHRESHQIASLFTTIYDYQYNNEGITSVYLEEAPIEYFTPIQ